MMANATVDTENLSVQAKAVAPNHDINFAAALRAQYAIETPKFSRRRRFKKSAPTEEDEPLIDNTAVLPLRSKKTQRLHRRQQKRDMKTSNETNEVLLPDLPTELLSAILSYMRPSDIFRLSRTSHTMRDFVLEQESVVTKSIIKRRYWTLYRCFPLPVAFKDVPEDAKAGLLSERRLEGLNIHRKSYHQHIKMVDPLEICTCMTCVFAWNNLCLILDLHHWQRNLEQREPIPMIARGTNPQWNHSLLERNADVVRKAMDGPLYYACILEKHLSTITGTILRFGRWKKKGAAPKARLYNLTDSEVLSGTDAFLERSGPPSYDFPFHRDNYYMTEAYLPNRKWGIDGKWYYYALPPAQHERDLGWVKSQFNTTISPEKRAQQLANLKDHNVLWAQYIESKQQSS